MARSTRKRQTRLEFTPLPSSSPASASYHSQIRERAAAVGFEGSPRPPKRQKVAGEHVRSQTGESRQPIDIGDDILPTPEPSNRPKPSAVKLASIDTDSEDSLPSLPSRTPISKHQQGALAKGDNASRGKHSSRTKGSSPLAAIGNSASFLKSSRTLKSHGRHDERATRSRNTRPRAEDDDEAPIREGPKASDNIIEISGNDSASSDDMPITPARTRRRAKRSHGVPIMAESEDDDDDEIGNRPRKVRRCRRRQHRNEADMSVKDVVSVASDTDSTPKPAGGRRRGLARTQEEQQELDDDVQNLRTSSPDEDTRTPRSSAVKSQRQLALEKLKRRRAGIKDAEDEVVEIGDESPPISEADDSDEVQEVPPPRNSTRDMFDANEEDEDFLTDGEDHTLGAPEGLPLAFTRYASMKPKDLFKYAVEWMVQKKLNPGFNMVDEIYDLAFKKLDDEVKGLAGSKFESSAWKSDFLFALRARPVIAYNRFSSLDPQMASKDKCDACNRTGHQPTFEVQFQGRPYHISTLEDVEQPEDSDSNSDSDSDQEQQTRDARGQIILPESHSFFVGKFCMANAETAHSLQHWRFHLYEWVVTKLEEMGHLDAEKIVQRDSWGEPKRRKFANKVLDQMVDSRIVRELYRDYRTEVERARDAKQARWSYED